MLYFLLTFVLLAAIVSASILMKGVANIAAIALSVTVIVLNACLGAALVSLKMTGWRTNWAFLCELWVMWVSALFVLAIILLALYYFSGALRAAHIDWATSLLWLYWLDWKRRNSWAGELPALLVICLSIAVFAIKKSPPSLLSLAIAMVLLFYQVTHPPEWLKSQPILAR
jgi:hypothetical protein